ncbi:hypothetical protein HOY81_17375 [Streptomyces sp. JJ36]|nr:hypothetical protein [Streptomyces sp. JJ36]
MAGSCFYALATEPRGPWDEDALTGIEAMAFTTLALGVLPLALTALALRRRVLSPWWLAPPMALALLALARWIHVTQQYP